MKRKKKVSKLQVLWRLLIVISMLINAFQLQDRIVKTFMSQPAIKRFAMLTMIDGLKYRLLKR